LKSRLAKKQKKGRRMVLIKKIKLNMLENQLEDIVVMCSQIKVSQEELNYIKSKVEENEEELSTGIISKNLYNSKKTDLEKEKGKLDRKINSNIKNSLKKLQKLKNVLNEIEI
jgi:hypothetical protein